MKKSRLAEIVMLCLMAACIQIGCGGASFDTAVTEEAAAEAPMEEMYHTESMDMIVSGSGEMKEMEKLELVGEEAGLEQNESQAQRKLIKTVDLNLETENYDSLMEGLSKEIERLSGYIEFKDAYHGDYNSKIKGYRNRRASITARIPVEKLEEFTGKVSEIGNLTYESERVEDVTLQYVDLSSHKKMLLTEQERLMELLENAGTMEDIIAIESRLSEVRYQIESMESQLRTFDNQVDYSTVHIEVQEVERYTPQPEEGAWDRIKTGFSENVYNVTSGIKNFAIEFVIAIPILVIWAVVITVGVLLGRIIWKKKQKHPVEELVQKQRLFSKGNLKKEKEIEDIN